MNKSFLLGLLIVLLLSTISSCRSIPNAQPGLDLVVATALLQKEIPGQQHVTVKDYLMIELKDYNREQCTIDSVYYMNNNYLMNNDQIDLKILLDGVLPAKNSAFFNPEPNIATLFYHKNTTAFYLKIENIKRIEPLYLP